MGFLSREKYYHDTVIVLSREVRYDDKKKRDYVSLPTDQVTDTKFF